MCVNVGMCVRVSQQKRAARLESAAPGSIEGGGPETRSGTVSLLVSVSQRRYVCVST